MRECMQRGAMFECLDGKIPGVEVFSVVIFQISESISLHFHSQR